MAAPDVALPPQAMIQDELPAPDANIGEPGSNVDLPPIALHQDDQDQLPLPEANIGEPAERQPADNFLRPTPVVPDETQPNSRQKLFKVLCFIINMIQKNI